MYKGIRANRRRRPAAMSGIQKPKAIACPRPNGSVGKKWGDCLSGNRPYFILRESIMLTTPRWIAEVRLMSVHFPPFQPFAVPGVEAGFRGHLVGPRTRIAYAVLIKSPISGYPENEPGVYMNPHPERHHWIHDNRLCYQREGHKWNPSEDTFAQTLIMAMKYVAEFDGR
jgi:hypothetical protein